MSDVIKRRENCLMVYVPEELDHHFAQQITKVVDEELEKGEISQLVFLERHLWTVRELEC